MNTILSFQIVLFAFACAKADDSAEASFSDLTTVLQYGDSCDYETEKLRQNFSINFVGTSDLQEKLAMLESFQKDIVQRGKALCSAKDLLLCNKKSGTCGCGEVGTFQLFGNSMGKRYKVENGKCRWAEGSGCVSSDLADKLGVSTDSKCASTSNCVAKKDGSSCTFANVLAYALQHHRTKASELMNDLHQGKICSCEVGSGITDSKEKENVGQQARLKRHVMPGLDTSSFEKVVGALAGLAETV